ncbi:MAG: (2Fe-2S)-binding protein [Rhodocyclaceae bacterium]|jgi:[NiFe] hydrogenase diaphorase moiety small subunit|nr:(2Fe-2S)-binding protein [Rhodocyclaceae bacterium]
MTKTFVLDGKVIPFEEGETIMEAASAAGVYIPHLCHHPEFKPHGSCKLCTVSIGGRLGAACTNKAAEGMKVESETAALNADRLALTQMLFVEGNHVCPSCEKSGNCQLQAVAYHLGMLTPHFPHFYPARDVDASHPDVMLERNRCILCELCVRASRDIDGKNVFGIGGRGIKARLIVNSASGRLADTDMSVTDRAAEVCPTGAIIRKRHGFTIPIGKRLYDHHDIAEVPVAGMKEPKRG